MRAGLVFVKSVLPVRSVVIGIFEYVRHESRNVTGKLLPYTRLTFAPVIKIIVNSTRDAGDNIENDVPRDGRPPLVLPGGILFLLTV